MDTAVLEVMIIQALLLMIVVVVAWRFLRNPESHHIKAWKKMTALLFVALATTAVLAPELATRIANLVGVGRGADLLLYAVTASLMFTGISRYIRSKQERRDIVVLARKLAILESVERYGRPGHERAA